MGTVKINSDRWARLQNSLKKSGWTEYGALDRIEHFDHRDDGYTRGRRDALTNVSHEKAVFAALDSVIAALGLGGEYGDRTEEVKVSRTRPTFGTPSYSPYGGYYHSTPRYETYEATEQVVDRGAARFLADIKAAAESTKGAEAAQRIADALKTKK